jgi:lipopolysaccharide/colanic/teichoic acid biosynthesis glycosyltransferase
MYKFRTMVENAEQGRGAVMAEDGDARVTAIGLFLRKTRLDELPQLMNVFFGDMSLVGPRPERPEIAIALSKDFPHFWRRLETKAGLTGLAQVKAGYAADSESYQQKLAWDLKYLEQQSLFLDLKIAFQTISVVLTGRGAR